MVGLDDWALQVGLEVHQCDPLGGFPAPVLNVVVALAAVLDMGFRFPPCLHCMHVSDLCEAEMCLGDL